MSDPTTWNAGDFHRWERPPGAPCPDCDCCTANLCTTAAAREAACGMIGTSADYDLSACPCSAIAVARVLLAKVADVDPSHPSRADSMVRWEQDAIEQQYGTRNAYLIGAALSLARAGVPVGITRDDSDPHPVVLTIELPDAGQVTWHLPDSPNGYGLPAGAPWDGHDTATKYERLSTWLTATAPAGAPA